MTTWHPLIRKKLTITSPTSGCRSVGIVRSRIQTMEVFFIPACVWRNRVKTWRCQDNLCEGQDSSGAPPKCKSLSQLASATAYWQEYLCYTMYTYLKLFASSGIRITKHKKVEATSWQISPSIHHMHKCSPIYQRQNAKVELSQNLGSTPWRCMVDMEIPSMKRRGLQPVVLEGISCGM
jgi:hypothetical protein